MLLNSVFIYLHQQRRLQPWNRELRGSYLLFSLDLCSKSHIFLQISTPNLLFVDLQLHWEEERTLGTSTDDNLQRRGRSEQDQTGYMAKAQDESPWHGRAMGQKSSSGGRNGENLQRTRYAVSSLPSRYQCPSNASGPTQWPSSFLGSSLIKLRSDAVNKATLRRFVDGE